jgi:putative Ca2+/H+ antiporter (TMEM165/GDT1 family)
VAVFIFEWGDLTQILTANLAAHYHDSLSVGVGALAALWTVAAVAVVSGQGLLKVLNLGTIRFVTAAILLALGVYAAVTAAR